MDPLSCSPAFGHGRLETLDESSCYLWSPVLTGARTPDPPLAFNEIFGQSLLPAASAAEVQELSSESRTPPAVGQLAQQIALSGSSLASMQVLKSKLQQLEAEPPRECMRGRGRLLNSQFTHSLQAPNSTTIESSEEMPLRELSPHPLKVGTMIPAIAVASTLPKPPFAVPPPPQVVARRPRPKIADKTSAEPQTAGPVVSVGSIGHPKTCSEACPYVKRKGGCRDGASCPKCHLCFWQRPGVKVAASHAMGEPRDCQSDSDAGRPVDLPTWALQGAVLCAAAVPYTQVVDRPRAGGGAGPQADSTASSGDGPLSVGSIGHPHSCGQACKFHGKGKGCKDGRWCVRCHLCRWKRCVG